MRRPSSGPFQAGGAGGRLNPPKPPQPTGLYSEEVILCGKKNCLYVLFVPYRKRAVINCDLLEVPHLQVMAKEEMTSAQGIKSKYIQGFHKSGP